MKSDRLTYFMENIIMSSVSHLTKTLIKIVDSIFSFKERGARYALLKLTAEEKKIGVISASLGNHAQGLSYHAFLLGVPCTVVMPNTAPIMKIQRCRSFKANVLVIVS